MFLAFFDIIISCTDLRMKVCRTRTDPQQMFIHQQKVSYLICYVLLPSSGVALHEIGIRILVNVVALARDV